LADSVTPNVFTGQIGPLVGSNDYYIGVSWNIPTSVGNIIQSDSYSADISFYTEQYRNNPNFVCPQPRRITSIDGSGWASVLGNFTESWQSDARWGDGGTSGMQNEIRIGLPGGSSPIVQTHTSNATGLWRSGVAEDFTLTYDGSGGAIFTVGDKTITTLSGVPAVGGPNLGLTIKVGSQAPEATVELSDVKLDGIFPAGPTSISVSSPNKKAIVISGDTQLADGFTLTGKIKATWTTTPTGTGGEQLGLLIQVD